MASQSVLLPSDASLFITDKSWLRPGKESRPGQNTFRLGQPSEIDGLSVTVVKTAIRSGRKARRDTRVAKAPQYRSLQFVNTTQSKPGEQDKSELRRLVRSHVMTGTRRRPNAQLEEPSEFEEDGQTLFEALDTRSEEFDEVQSQHSSQSWPSSTSSEMTLIPSGTSTPLYGATSFEIQPQFHRFMNYYTIETASQLYPLQAYFGFNPVKSFWFPMALTDEVLLYTIMYSAAYGLSQKEPDKESNDLNQLAGPIFRLLTDRLGGGTTIKDATIGAVSCLVMVENQAGNWDRSQIHMNGLQQMIKTKGGLESIDPGLVMKIIRADIDGSVDNLTRPVLPPLRRMAPTLYSTLPPNARMPLSKAVGALLGIRDFRGHMKDVLLDLSKFTCAVQYYTTRGHQLVAAINPRSFDEDLLSIERDLLEMSCLTLEEEVVQLAALIFAKSFGRGLPFAIVGTKVLSKRLKQALSLTLNEPLSIFSDSIMVWLLSMGGLASAKSQPEHLWFVDELVRLDCVDELEMLRQVLFVDVVHETASMKLFEEVVLLRGLRAKWNEQAQIYWI